MPDLVFCGSPEYASLGEMFHCGVRGVGGDATLPEPSIIEGRAAVSCRDDRGWRSCGITRSEQGGCHCSEALPPRRPHESHSVAGQIMIASCLLWDLADIAKLVETEGANVIPARRGSCRPPRVIPAYLRPYPVRYITSGNCRDRTRREHRRSTDIVAFASVAKPNDLEHDPALTRRQEINVFHRGGLFAIRPNARAAPPSNR
jgi:hypothetical protein